MTPTNGAASFATPSAKMPTTAILRLHLRRRLPNKPCHNPRSSPPVQLLSPNQLLHALPLRLTRRHPLHRPSCRQDPHPPIFLPAPRSPHVSPRCFSSCPTKGLPIGHTTTRLESTLTNSIRSVDSKTLTNALSSLVATLRKNRGRGPLALHHSQLNGSGNRARLTCHHHRFVGAITSVRNRSSCVSRRRISVIRLPSTSTSLGLVLAL